MNLTENGHAPTDAIILVPVSLTTGFRFCVDKLTFQLFIYERKQWHANHGLSATVHVHCNKEVRPGTEVRYVYSYVHTMSLSSETDENSRTLGVLHQPWCYTDHREYGTGLRTQRTSAQFHHFTMRNNDAWGRKEHSDWLMWNDEVWRMNKHGFSSWFER